eukprot:TRINITY_DN4573_c0_g1_i2.p1 TRINITY_DN4573_c0_g1~~TRINITY_DN4573_c0_g1_i2.p1  ORF type:complete len:310 (-),score=82.31 TRINITY_DN4573_c0_g1_i2:23-838(-)
MNRTVSLVTEKKEQEDSGETEMKRSASLIPKSNTLTQQLQIQQPKKSDISRDKLRKMFTHGFSRMDVDMYLANYPKKAEYKNKNDNILFYSNQKRSIPGKMYLGEIHTQWWAKYDTLEFDHSYIQWLFPIREKGLNPKAQELQKHEAESFQSDPQLQEEILKSFEMMLDFYGMRMVDRETGVIERSQNYIARYRHLNNSFHNYLRITRILKCLGEVGLERYKLPWLRHLVNEIFKEKVLTNCQTSCTRYWSQVLRDPEERRQLEDEIMEYL